MKRIGTFALCLLVALVAFVSTDLTIHSGEVGATSVTKQAVSLLKNRYGITSTPEEINILDGATLTVTELNYVDGVTSAIQTQLDAKTTSTLADTKVFIGNSGSLAVAQSLSGLFTITNAGVATMAVNQVGTNNIIDNTVSSADILNGTIADTDLAVNAVTATKIITNTVTVTVTAPATGTQVAVEPGSILLNWQPVSGFSNAVTVTKFVLASDTLIVNTDVGSANGVINAVLIRPSQ